MKMHRTVLAALMASMLAATAHGASLNDQQKQRCEWGRQVVSLAQQGYQQNLPRDKVLDQLGQLGAGTVWKARMANSITAWVYKGQGTTLADDGKLDYFSRCRAYYIGEPQGVADVPQASKVPG